MAGKGCIVLLVDKYWPCHRLQQRNGNCRGERSFGVRVAIRHPLKTVKCLRTCIACFAHIRQCLSKHAA
jgi:hypothetical protein